MKTLLIASLIAAQTLAIAQPAFAASIDDQSTMMQQSRGAFAGARLRVPLGGERQAPHAGLAFAAVQRTGTSDGSSHLRFSEGAELGLTGAGKARLMLAGHTVIGKKLGAAEDKEEKGEENDGKKRHGVSTLALVLGGVLLAGGIAAAIFADALEKASD